MTEPVYYNEFDPYAAAWIRNLINAGLIAPGIVDERSIEDVRPDDLDGFTQCHFFAGLGGWSYALRAAGWPDHRRVWTASCPCQPYSAAGEGGGFADERHLWPHFFHLVREQKRRPESIFGEQVASKFAEPWVDLVHADVEALGYAFGCIPFPSASVGAPHIRDRLYWMANDELQQRPGGQRTSGVEHEARGRQQGAAAAAGLRDVGGMGHANNTRLEGLRLGHQTSRGWNGAATGRAAPSEFGGMANDDRVGREVALQHGAGGGTPDRFGETSLVGMRGDAVDELSCPTNGFWRAADWLACRDGKWRPVEPGTFPLANGAPARMGRLRAYGNAINVEQARIFIQSAMTVLD